MTVPNVLQDYGVNDVLQRRYNVAGGAPAPTIAPEVMPVIPGATFELDQYRLAGIRLCGAGLLVTGLAGQNSQLLLANPDGSGVSIIVEDGAFSSAGSNTILALLPRSLSGIVANSIPRDTAWGIPAATRGTAAIVSLQQTAVPADARPIHFITTSAYTFVRIGVVLRPGYTLLCYADVTGTALYGSLRWSERRLQPAEL